MNPFVASSGPESRAHGTAAFGPRRRVLAILGSTGSIGRNTLEVVQDCPERFTVAALAAGENWELLARQIERFRPRLAAVRRPAHLPFLQARLRELGVGPLPELVSGPAGLTQVAAASGADLLVAAVVGVAGLEAIHAALLGGCDLALANKEALVVAGPLLLAAAAASGAAIIPIDSEHSAIHQCLRAGEAAEVDRIVLTASGGPFLRLSAAEIAGVSPQAALRHPTWRMGDRITLDSASLMNKGFEVIEACHLFQVPEERVEVLVHPQSIVHSMVEFRDGSVLAQLGTADMRTPIQYALTYPERVHSPRLRLKLEEVGKLEFELPDPERFPCLALAREAMRAGGATTAVLNAADEIAVEAFSAGKIAFPAIAAIVAATMREVGQQPAGSVEEILVADGKARTAAAALVASQPRPAGTSGV